MENHPIPQDVTGFKFRLIGSVTVKQFLYILGAGALCGVFFIMPISFLIKWPAIMLIAGIGAALAFIPIEGRPMDIMVMNFLKALPAENRFIFHKKGAEGLLHDYFTPSPVVKAQPVTQSVQKDNRRELLMNQLVRKNMPYKVDEQEREQMQNISGMFDNSDTPVTGMTNIDTQDNIAPIVETVATLAPDVASQSSTYTPAIETPSAPPLAVVESAPQPEPILAPTEPALQPAAYAPEPEPVQPQATTPATTVAPENQIASGFPDIPDTPNIVIGIVKDARGKVLPNIIVEVVDSTGNPVRAFKTNALGQFASATPLPVGNYQILLEDTRRVHEFNPVDIVINNEIFQPIEIISTDQREKLRQELFGAPAPQQ